MTWKIDLKDDFGAVQVSCSGKLSMDDMVMMVIEAGFLARQNDYRNILFDLTDAAMIFPAEQLGILLDSYAECGIPLTTRTALVVSTQDVPKDLSRLLATARERGYQVDLLIDRQQAENWFSNMPDR